MVFISVLCFIVLISNIKGSEEPSETPNHWVTGGTTLGSRLMNVFSMYAFFGGEFLGQYICSKENVIVRGDIVSFMS